VATTGPIRLPIFHPAIVLDPIRGIDVLGWYCFGQSLLLDSQSAMAGMDHMAGMLETAGMPEFAYRHRRR
jgi:hypothetical protein